MENRKKVLNLLGLATRAGKTASGEFMTEKAIKSGKAYLVIVSEEASDNTKKMFENSCAYYKVPVYQFGMKEELGHAMGKGTSRQALLIRGRTALSGAKARSAGKRLFRQNPHRVAGHRNCFRALCLFKFEKV